jgi:hypothetical protein
MRRAKSSRMNARNDTIAAVHRGGRGWALNLAGDDQQMRHKDKHQRRVTQLTDRAAVLSAIGEYDQLGQESFLRKYGFRPSTGYILEYEGRDYDSKAIAAVAFGFQFPDKGPLGSGELHGGVTPGAAAARLMELGFEIFGSKSGLPITAARQTVKQRPEPRAEFFSDLSDEQVLALWDGSWRQLTESDPEGLVQLVQECNRRGITPTLQAPEGIEFEILETDRPLMGHVTTDPWLQPDYKI